MDLMLMCMWTFLLYKLYCFTWCRFDLCKKKKKSIPVALSVQQLLDNGFEKGFRMCSKYGALHPLLSVIKCVVILCCLVYCHKLGSNFDIISKE